MSSPSSKITIENIQNFKQSLRIEKSPYAQSTVYKNRSQNDATQKQDDNEFNPLEKEKLMNIFKKIQKMKDEKRMHDLVMNLPTRMLKSFDQNKFDLLNDRCYYYNEDTFLDSINFGLNNKRRSLKVRNVSQFLDLKSQGTLGQDGENQDEELMEDNVYEQTRLNKLKNFLLKVIDQIPIIQPSSQSKLIWDLINMITIIVCLYLLPIAMVFNFHFSDLVSINFLVLIPTLLIFDIILNLNTGYFLKGQVIKSRIQNIEKYIKTNLLIDIICVFPFVISLYNEAINLNSNGQIGADYKEYPQIILLPFFFKGFSLSSTLRKIEERFNIPRLIINIIQLAKLLFTIILINHLFACLWVYAAKIQIDDGEIKTWMSYQGIQHSDWTRQYLVAFYFTTVTMITVGYGDVLPKNNLEYVLCIVTMMLACGVFGYSLNEIGSIFSNFFQVDNEIKKKLILIQRFMSKKNINSKLQYQIREYLEYYWREQAQTNQEQEANIIQSLSESLRQKLLFEANKIVLRDSPIFKHNFSKSVIEQTVPLIKEIKYSPETLICQKGIQDDQAIYFIENGSVDIILTTKAKKQQCLLRLGKGESFGAHSFFTGLPRINNVRSNEFTTVLKIRRQDFIQLISNQSEDLETFCNIRDSISHLNDYTKIGLKCKGCNSNYHMVNDCQFLHYIPNKARIIKSYNDQLNNDHLQRIYCQRRELNQKYPYKNSRAVCNLVLKHLQVYLEHNESLLDISDDDIQYSDGHYNLSDYQSSEDNKDHEKEGNSAAKKVWKPGQEFVKQKSNQNEAQNFNQAIKDFIHLVGQEQLMEAGQKSKGNMKVDPQINVIQCKTSSLCENISENQSSINAIQTMNKINVSNHDRIRSNSNANEQKLEKPKAERLKKSRSSTIINQFTHQSSINKSINKVKLENSLSFNEDNLEQLLPEKQFFSILEKQYQFYLLHLMIRSSAVSDKQKKKKNKGKKKEDSFKLDQILQQLEVLFSQKELQTDLQENDTKEVKKHRNDNNEYENDIFYNFDRMKLFVKYKPRYNYSTVISRYNQQQDQARKLLLIRKNNRQSHRKKNTLLTKIQNKILDQNSSQLDFRGGSFRQIKQQQTLFSNNNNNNNNTNDSNEMKPINSIKLSESTFLQEKDIHKKQSARVSLFHDASNSSRDDMANQQLQHSSSVSQLIQNNDFTKQVILNDFTSKINELKGNYNIDQSNSFAKVSIRNEEIVLDDDGDNQEQTLAMIPHFFNNISNTIANRSLLDK